MNDQPQCEHEADSNQHTDKGHNKARYRLTIEQFLEGGLLVPLFQPIVDLHGHAIYGFEGTIRGPAGSGLRSPLDLLAQAHIAGLRSQLEAACCQCQIEQFLQLRLPGRLFLNLSCETALQIDAGTHEALRDFIVASGVDPRRLVLELNEHVDDTQIPALQLALSRSRANGVGIALDNLDASPAALRLWAELQPDIVKIDRYLIEGLHAERAQREAVRRMQMQARQFGTLLVAEGIEHPADLDVLKTFGIRFGQGYLTGRPSRRPNLSTHAPNSVAAQALNTF